MASLAPFLIRRGAVYHIRCRIPLDLVALIGKAEYKRSLATTCPKTARKQAALVKASLTRDFAWEWQNGPNRLQTDPGGIRNAAGMFPSTPQPCLEAGYPGSCGEWDCIQRSPRTHLTRWSWEQNGPIGQLHRHVIGSPNLQ